MTALERVVSAQRVLVPEAGCCSKTATLVERLHWLCGWPMPLQIQDPQFTKFSEQVDECLVLLIQVGDVDVELCISPSNNSMAVPIEHVVPTLMTARSRLAETGISELTIKDLRVARRSLFSCEMKPEVVGSSLCQVALRYHWGTLSISSYSQLRESLMLLLPCKEHTQSSEKALTVALELCSEELGTSRDDRVRIGTKISLTRVRLVQHGIIRRDVALASFSLSESANEKRCVFERNRKQKEEKMEVAAYIRLGELTLTLHELVSLREQNCIRINCQLDQALSLWFDQQCIAKGVLRESNGEMYFQVTEIPSGISTDAATENPNEVPVATAREEVKKVAGNDCGNTGSAMDDSSVREIGCSKGAFSGGASTECSKKRRSTMEEEASGVCETNI